MPKITKTERKRIIQKASKSVASRHILEFSCIAIEDADLGLGKALREEYRIFYGQEDCTGLWFFDDGTHLGWDRESMAIRLVAMDLFAEVGLENLKETK